MRFVTLIALLISAQAFATEYVSRQFKFFFDGRNLGYTTYYTCDAARSALESHLKTLGAQDMHVRCNGGLENWGSTWQYTALSLNATFTAPQTMDASRTDTVRLRSRGNEGCDLNVGMLKKLIPMFPDVTVANSRTNCFNSNSPWSYTLNIKH